jgi:tetratricopeptide (TPR) repeat protein
MGDLSGAIEAFETSLQIQEQLGETPGRAVTVANIGGIHLRRQSWPEALQCLEQALALYEKAEDAIGMATTLNNLGLVQRRLGDLDGAYQRYARTRDLMKASGDLLRATIPVHNMALIHEEKGEYREALRLMEEVVAIDKRIGHPDLRQDLETFGRIRAKLDRERDRRPSA